MAMGMGDGLVAAGAVGIGLRPPHVAALIASRPRIGWVEAHTAYYLGGGPAVRALARLREEYPLALHGVGLSLGSAEGLDARHLGRVAELARRVEPALLSEHLSWSIAGGRYLNHLLPLPYTEESLGVVADNVLRAQDAFGRRVMIENPSSYLRFRHSPIPEPEFLAALARRTGCGLLCDVNNVFVSCHNFDRDPAAYLDALPAEAVGEIHLAGHSRNEVEGRAVLIDDHSGPVAPAVWALYAHALTRFGPRPSLIEWDTEVPALPVLLAEARHAERVVEAVRVAA